MTFSAPFTPKGYPGHNFVARNLTLTAKGSTTEALAGAALFHLLPTTNEKNCLNIEYRTVSARPVALFERGGNPPPPPPPPPEGTCTVYSAVASVGPSKNPKSRTHSGKQPVKLYPSWPASSPWVTAVGATRFVGQTVGGEEMAADQFGSGGGFSSQFNQSEAQWQVEKRISRDCYVIAM